MTQTVTPQCKNCARFDFASFTIDNRRKCDAFPKGIPDQIWFNEVSHTKPFPGDNGKTIVKVGD
jgi:hypothetical protein